MDPYRKTKNTRPVRVGDQVRVYTKNNRKTVADPWEYLRTAEVKAVDTRENKIRITCPAKFDTVGGNKESSEWEHAVNTCIVGDGREPDHLTPQERDALRKGVRLWEVGG
jgi:hypothetical protein